MTAYNNALFLWHDATGNLMGILAMHVYDFLFCGNDLFKKNEITGLKKIRTHERRTFEIFGLGFRQIKDGITIDQNLYVSFISPIDVKKLRSLRKNDKLSQEQKIELKRLTGQMMWVSTQTQTEVVFDVCWMSNTRKFLKVKLFFKANKALQKLKSKTGSITFPQLERPSNSNIVCNADTTYTILEDGSSQGGFYNFCLCHNDQNMAPIY